VPEPLQARLLEGPQPIELLAPAIFVLAPQEPVVARAEKVGIDREHVEIGLEAFDIDPDRKGREGERGRPWSVTE
jgi:hypothetical protein